MKTILMAVLLALAIPDASACPLFSECKPKIIKPVKPKPDPGDVRIAALEKRLTELEAQIRAYGAAFATHQAEIHALKKSR